MVDPISCQLEGMPKRMLKAVGYCLRLKRDRPRRAIHVIGECHRKAHIWSQFPFFAIEAVEYILQASRRQLVATYQLYMPGAFLADIVLPLLAATASSLFGSLALTAKIADDKAQLTERVQDAKESDLVVSPPHDIKDAPGLLAQVQVVSK